jgi:ABC-type sugar transport system ATPase subunit
MTADAPSLRMEGISKRFPGTLAVDSVDFEARPGEVHALMGENGAGKSTLMKILAGSFDNYEGRIAIDGTEARLHSPAAARSFGIGMIYQELSLARPISIAENLAVGRLPRRWGGVLDRAALRREAIRSLERVGLRLDPSLPVEAISQHEAQLVEIAKALDTHPRILVMDEPTSALSRDEVQRLFEIIRQLRQEGLTIVYISHHLSEVFEIADRVTVLRDGKKIATREIESLTPPELVQMMVGQTIDEFYSEREARIGAQVLRADRLSRRGFFHDVSLSVHEGEILGIAGLSGAGRTELLRSMCGLDPLDEGSVDLDGTTLRRGSYPDAMKRGLYYLSEDRKSDGLFLRLSVRRNLVSALIEENTRAGFHSRGSEEATAVRMIEELAIATASSTTDVGNLSGGNQQKVLLGKWLAARPRVLVLDEPSRGVDVKAKRKIHEAVISLADRGGSVILISSDLPELVGLADRVMVMREGHRIGELSKEQLTEESILLAVNGEGLR